jgi:glutamine amidotransferase
VITICHLTYYPAGVMPVREHLENGAKLNPHGHGFAIGNGIIGRSMNPDEAIDRFLLVRERSLKHPAMFHSRNATGDSPVTFMNCQPFWGKGNLMVAHNGYLFPHEGEKSDSLIFTQEILPRYDLRKPQDRALLEERMGPNKAVILKTGKRAGIILNRHLGIMDGKTWHSNADYLGIPHIIPGICPACHAETDLTPVCARCEEKAQGRRLLLEDKHVTTIAEAMK